jgi:hypothetical protein
MNTCETTDFVYPLLGDVYHPIVSQGAYGNMERAWVLDRTVACNFSPAGTAYAEDVKPNVKINTENHLIGRTKVDLRLGMENGKYSITNIIIANIRTKDGTSVYNETAGARAGKSTVYEIATQDPIVGPFGNVEYYKVIIRRSENQAADI